jgi:hypothetical protein
VVSLRPQDAQTDGKGGSHAGMALGEMAGLMLGVASAWVAGCKVPVTVGNDDALVVRGQHGVLPLRVSFESPDTYSLPVPLSRTDANTNDQRYHYSFRHQSAVRRRVSDHFRHHSGAKRHCVPLRQGRA